MASVTRRLVRGTRNALKKAFPRTFRRVSGIRGVAHKQIALVAKRILGESTRLEERIMKETEEQYDSAPDKEKWGEELRRRIVEEPRQLVAKRTVDFARFAATKSVLDKYGIRNGREIVFNAEHELLGWIYDRVEQGKSTNFSENPRIMNLFGQVGEVVGPQKAVTFSKEVFYRCNFILGSLSAEIERLEDIEAARIRKKAARIQKKQPKKR